MMIASLNGHLEVVRSLLDRGADIEAQCQVLPLPLPLIWGVLFADLKDESIADGGLYRHAIDGIHVTRDVTFLGV